MINRRFSRFAQGIRRMNVAISVVTGVWILVLLVLTAGCAFPIEQPSQASEPTPGAGRPSIALEPAVGAVGTLVTVQGAGWNPGDAILIYLVPPGETDPLSYASAGAVADAEGRFGTGFAIPSGDYWEPAGGLGSQALATVIARVG
jgi:hypothetical protein